MPREGLHCAAARGLQPANGLYIDHAMIFLSRMRVLNKTKKKTAMQAKYDGTGHNFTPFFSSALIRLATSRLVASYLLSSTPQASSPKFVVLYCTISRSHYHWKRSANHDTKHFDLHAASYSRSVLPTTSSPTIVLVATYLISSTPPASSSTSYSS